MVRKFVLCGLVLGYFSLSLAAGKTTFTLGMVLEPPHLDPTQSAAAAVDEVVYGNIFEGLTQIDANGRVQPSLAKSWQISKDQKTYTFFLESGVLFHNQQPLTAKDVKFSLDRLLGTDSRNAQKKLFKPIEQVEVVDDYQLRVHLKHPLSLLLYYLGFGDAVIVNSSTADTNKQKPVGTGAFQFESWQPGHQILLKKNPNYWGTKAKLDEIRFRFIADSMSALNALLTNSVDGFANFPAPEALGRLNASSGFQTYLGLTEGETIVAINHQRSPFSKLKVRQAMAYAVDRQAIIDGAMFGHGTPIGSHFSPNHPDYVDLTGHYPHDLNQAKTLLAEAGFENGFQASLKLPPTPYARRSGEILAAQLKKIGIQLKIIPLEWAQWLEEVFTHRDYDLTIVAHTEPLDIGIYAREDYYFNYQNPAFNLLIQQWQQAPNPSEQRVLIQQAQRLLAEDCTNLFLFQLPKVGVWKKDFKGMWLNSPIQANVLTRAYWQ